MNRIGRRGGFTGGKRLQGGWIAAAIGLVGALVSANSSKKQAKSAEKQVEASDPYGKYRDDAAQKLNDLISNPSSIEGTAEYKARQDAAARLLASQGYTGSGNAVVAAAEAGGASYQQAFNNLAMLAGAGAQPGGSNAAIAAATDANQTYLSGIAGIGNNAVNLANTVFNRPATSTPSGSSGSAFSSGVGPGSNP